MKDFSNTTLQPFLSYLLEFVIVEKGGDEAVILALSAGKTNVDQS